MQIIFAILLFCLPCFADRYEMAKNHALFYKKELPYRTNDNLVLTDLFVVNEIVIYHYKVNDTLINPVSKLNKERLEKYKESLKLIAINNSCKDKEVLNLLNNGVKIEHLFYYEFAKLLFEIHIDKKICDSL